MMEDKRDSDKDKRQDEQDQDDQGRVMQEGNVSRRGAQETGTQQMPRVPAEGEKGGEKGTIVLFGREVSKKKVVMAGLGGFLALALIGGGAWYAMSREPQDAKPPVQQVEKQERQVICIGAKADGWVKGESSPVIAHIVNEDEKVDYYHAYDANVAVELDVPADGDYKVSFITPVNKDGSIYEVPAETAVKAETVKKGEKGDGEGTLPFTFKPVKAADASTDDLNAVAEAVTEAVKKGDGTLSGENGTKVIETVKANLKANQNADEKKVEEETQKAEESKPVDGKDEAGTGNGSAPAGGSSSQSQGGDSGSNGSSGGSNNSGGESKPQHTHNWVAETTVVHHDAQYRTDKTYHPAVIEYHTVCNSCGAIIDGHAVEHLESSETCESYTTNKQIIISNEWYEEVQTLVSEAWDETVNTGRYTCSCGAVK